MSYYYIKALHIIFVITWFAGLFYIVRLFIYHSEANEMTEPKKSILINQYKIMEKRLWYGITWPSAIITLIFGSSLITHHLPLSESPWLIAKLVLLLGLYLYHFSCGKILKEFKADKVRFSSDALRIWNEVATVLLFAIVFVAIVKSMQALWWGIFGIVALSIALMLGIKVYKNLRQVKEA